MFRKSGHRFPKEHAPLQEKPSARRRSFEELEHAMAEIKPRIKLDKTDVKKGDTVEVKTLVSHVMETGLRHDADGKLIPRMIINKFTCELNGKLVFECDPESAVS